MIDDVLGRCLETIDSPHKSPLDRASALVTILDILILRIIKLEEEIKELKDSNGTILGK